MRVFITSGWYGKSLHSVSAFRNKQYNKGLQMKINFECKSCHRIFDSEVGQVSINEKTIRPDFEKDILCPSCGKKTIDDVLLTELGQSQLTEATWDL